MKGGRCMTYKQIEASREARLWIGQIIVPAATAVGGIMMIPEVREAVKAKAIEIKKKADDKLKKQNIKKVK